MAADRQANKTERVKRHLADLVSITRLVLPKNKHGSEACPVANALFSDWSRWYRGAIDGGSSADEIGCIGCGRAVRRAPKRRLKAGGRTITETAGDVTSRLSGTEWRNHAKDDDDF